MGAVEEVTDATFDERVLKSPMPVMVDYWADWCSPCKQIEPIVEELAATYGDRFRFVKLDTNVNPLTPASMGIMGLPTLQIFVGGTVVASMTGGKTKAALIKAVEQHL